MHRSQNDEARQAETWESLSSSFIEMEEPHWRTTFAIQFYLYLYIYLLKSFVYYKVKTLKWYTDNWANPKNHTASNQIFQSDMFYSFTKETKIHSVLVVMKNCV